MCLTNETIDELHAITSAIKDEQELRDKWASDAKEGGWNSLNVTKSEGERIFADRIAAHESRLKELGWSRTIRVNEGGSGAGAGGGSGTNPMNVTFQGEKT